MFVDRIKFSLASVVLIAAVISLGEFYFVSGDDDEVYRVFTETGLYILVLSLLMLCFGLVADWYVYRLKKQAQAERIAIYRATVWASHHVLNNFLNKLYLIQHHALQNGEFTDELAESMGKMIQEAAEQLMDLSKIDPITADEIRSSVAP